MPDRVANNVRRVDIESMFRDIFFENPELKKDPWLSRMYAEFRFMEDEGERAPPLSEIFEDELEPLPVPKEEQQEQQNSEVKS